MSIASSQRFSSSSSYFKDILTKVGIKLEQTDIPNVLLKEQALIIRETQKELENHANYPNNIPDFISGVEFFCRSKNLFKKALQHSILQNRNDVDNDDLTKGPEQESIFRILLSVDCLQNEIISLLLNEITHHIDEEEDEEMVWLRLLLGPLLFLPYITDSKTLTFRLLEILEIATSRSQIQLLIFIPDIIPDNDHDETAKKLITILNQSLTSNDLTCAIINCLNHLNLSDDAKFDIEDHILALLNTTSSLATFSLIFYFLVTNCKSNLQNILLKTRNALDSIMESLTENEGNKSDKLLTFEEIERITTSSKTLSEGWISLLNCIKSANDHKSVDIIILMMLHKYQKHVIECIFKKKVKSRQLMTTLLETALQRYLVPQMLKDYIISILQISACLLRMTEPLCIEFAKSFYLQTFSHKHTDLQQRQQIVRSLITLTGNSDKLRTQSLSILKTIAYQHLDLLQAQAMQLMTLLDRIEDSDLRDVKLIYELLTRLTCGPRAISSMEAYQNMIHITVKKQLDIHKKSLKYSGIIGAVATAKNIATNLEDEQQNSVSSDVSYSSISDLPNENTRQAAKLLKIATQSTSSCPIAQGLYYDQLTQMVSSTEHLDKYFVIWLQDEISNNFQEVYITSDAPERINDIPLMVQYNLNTRGEIEVPIAVKISELTISAPANNSMMLVFAPLFRLLRSLNYRQYEGDLTSIDALLGCGVILPEIDPDIGIESYDSEQAPQVVDCLFHCINWFREIINAFVKQKFNTIKEKVLLRLTNLIELEELFVTSMKTLPDHKLPPSYFYNVNLDISSTSNLDKTKPSDKTRKRKHSADSTTKLTQTTQASTSKPARKSQPKEKETPDYNFREMDIDIILLLRYPLITTDDPVPENKLYLTLSQFKFILKDMVKKLNTVTKTGNLNVFSHLITVKPENLIKDCVRLMPHISRHLVKINDEIKKLLERSDEIHDAHEMFLQAATELKICFSLNLEMQYLVLSWSGFLIGKNLPLLRECLRAFVDEERASQLISAHHLILEYLKFILTLADNCLTLPCAVHLINIVKALCNVSTDVTPKKKLVYLSGKLLSIRWFNIYGLPESGAIANLHIDTLVKTHLNGSTLETVSNIVSWIHGECPELKSKDDHLTTFPSISKANFPILYRGVCTSLLEALQNELHGLTNQQHLDLWLTTATTMRNLMDIVKIQETRANLAAFLKKSMGILNVFLSQGLPILEIMLRSNSDKVVDILQTLQQTTRFMHHLCCHSKVKRDSTLMKHVPQMLRMLETLVYQVKAVLVANDCTSAFWMGTLKNKDLHGKEILSQSTNSTVDEQEDNEEDLPADEESDEESVRREERNIESDEISSLI